jgi:hypothetical protein
MPTYRNAREFVEAVVRAYRQLDSYSDTGKSHRPNCRRQRLCVFQTDYRAPADFRFEFKSPHPNRKRRHRWAKVVVGTHDATPYYFDESYGGEQSLEGPESLDLAVAGATGVSSGTAHTIASLFFSEVSGFTLLDLKRLRFRKDRVVDGVSCKAVSGLHPRGGRWTAWFGENDLLLRRQVRVKFRTEELRTDVRVGHAFPEGAFAPPRIEA